MPKGMLVDRSTQVDRFVSYSPDRRAGMPPGHEEDVEIKSTRQVMRETHEQLFLDTRGRRE